MKLTKNKELRALIKRHEYLRNRPKGVKVLDKLLSSVPNATLNSNLVFFVDYKRKSEFKGLTQYKGYDIKFVPTKINIIGELNYALLGDN